MAAEAVNCAADADHLQDALSYALGASPVIKQEVAAAVKHYLDSESFPEFPAIICREREKVFMSTDSPGTERFKRLFLERGERA
jgi:hypothetical protein